jgi:hypothetical protein
MYFAQSGMFLADLPTLAGLDELYDIERATTEPGT